MSELLGGSDADQLAGLLDEANKKIIQLGRLCDSDVQLATVSAIERTVLSKNLWHRVLGRDLSTIQLRASADNSTDKKLTTAARVEKNNNQQALIEFLSSRIPYSVREGEAEKLQELLMLCTERGQLLARLRKYLQVKTILKAWLWFHVPLSIALLAALLVHIFSVFYYW